MERITYEPYLTQKLRVINTKLVIKDLRYKFPGPSFHWAERRTWASIAI